MPTRRHLLLASCQLLWALPALAQEDEEPRSQKRALLIGIDRYEDNKIAALSGAAADATALQQTLIKAMGFPPENITVLTSKDRTNRPTRTNILKALDRLKAQTRADDIVFIFYAGHGIEQDKKSYLLPYDTGIGQQGALLLDTVIEAEKFRDALKEIHSQLLLSCFDMCRSKPIANARAFGEPNRLPKDKRGLTAGRSKFKDDKGKSRVPLTVTLYSCSPEQSAYESGGRGYFSVYLEKGIQGEAANPETGAVTVASLKTYLEAKVYDAVWDKYGQQQRPYIVREGPDVDDFVLATTGRRKPSAVGTAVQYDAEVVDLTATLRLTGLPSDARVSVDDRLLMGNEYQVDLPNEETKEVLVVVEVLGYRPIARRLLLRRGKVDEVPISLEKLPARPALPLVGRPKFLNAAKELRARSPQTPALAAYLETMCAVSGGEYWRGSSRADLIESAPPHLVALSSFFMGKTPVTVALWQEYAQAVGLALPPAPPWGWGEALPMVHVTWDNVVGREGSGYLADGKESFCLWASNLSGVALTLPTEAQFEYAAHGGKETEFPWGSVFDPKKCWGKPEGKGPGQPGAVNRTDAIYTDPTYGLSDLIGNVNQWCFDLYGAYQDSYQTNPKRLKSTMSSNRIFRGGSFMSTSLTDFYIAYRDSFPPTVSRYTIGFRLVAEP